MAERKLHELRNENTYDGEQFSEAELKFNLFDGKGLLMPDVEGLRGPPSHLLDDQIAKKARMLKCDAADRTPECLRSIKTIERSLRRAATLGQ